MKKWQEIIEELENFGADGLCTVLEMLYNEANADMTYQFASVMFEAFCKLYTTEEEKKEFAKKVAEIVKESQFTNNW